MEALPHDFLAGPGPEVSIEKVNFIEVGLAEYAPSWAVVLDGVLSEEECQQMITTAEKSVDGKWERAMVNVGMNEQKLITDIRNCGRILTDNQELATKIWKRCEPHLPELQVLHGNAHVLGNGPVKRAETYKMTRLNERLRFLKYTGGEYFDIHGDGMYITPSGEERSFYTIHLYLNERDSNNPLEGGATTFFGHDYKREYNIYPKSGRVLLFQQRGLMHAGQEVNSGTKYTVRTDVMYELVGGES